MAREKMVPAEGIVLPPCELLVRRMCSSSVFVESTSGARGAAVQLNWRAIWMSDAKMLGAGSAMAFMQNADPAEMMMTGKSVAKQIVNEAVVKIGSNRPAKRAFTITIQGVASASQSMAIRKAVLPSVAGASATFRAGTLTITVPPRGLDRDAIAYRLEQGMKKAKVQIRVISIDASSARAKVIPVKKKR